MELSAKTNGVRDIALPLALGALILLAWDWGVVAFKVSPMMLPRPAAVLDVVQKNFPLLREHAWFTVRDAASALALSTAVGIGLAFVLSIARWVRAALMPNLVLFELIPKIALAPLFIIWLGTGTESRLAYAFFLSIFPIVVSTTSGLVNTDAGLVRLCASLRASPWQTFLHVRLPYSLPLVFGGLKIGSTMAVIGVVVGEFITGSRGLGYIIMFASSQLEGALMVGAVLMLAALGTLLYVLVVLAERLIVGRFGRPAV
jgi:NitT/TauT family transport system permease protein